MLCWEHSPDPARLHVVPPPCPALAGSSSAGTSLFRAGEMWVAPEQN